MDVKYNYYDVSEVVLFLFLLHIEGESFTESK